MRFPAQTTPFLCCLALRRGNHRRPDFIHSNADTCEMNNCASEILKSVFQSSDGYRFIHEIVGSDEQVLNGIEINDAARQLLSIPSAALPASIPDMRDLLAPSDPALSAHLELALRGTPQRFTAQIEGLGKSEAFFAEIEFRRLSTGARSFLTSAIRNINA